MELISITSELMPKGQPNLTGVIKYPTIDRLGQELGKKVPLLMIFTLVRDFCNSINVVRNMNEAQMMEVSSMLLDECDNFRMEDYVMMFSMAKRGNLVKIFDHVDIDIVSKIMDEYWLVRNKAGQEKQKEEFQAYENKLKEIARTSQPIAAGEFDITQPMLNLADQLTKQAEEVKTEETKTRDERIKRMQENYHGRLTPEQQEEMKGLRQSTRKGWVEDEQRP